MIRKTAAITAASIAGVVIAGGAAVGANIGILNAVDDNSLGELSAETVITTPSIETDGSVGSSVDVASSPRSIQSFDVDVAGTVDIESGPAGLRLVEVQTSEGWSWVDTTTEPGTISLTFASGTDRLEFSAVSADDGTIDANVDRPIVTPAPQATSPAPGVHVDDDDDEDHDNDEDYEEDDDDYHEGREDDD